MRAWIGDRARPLSVIVTIVIALVAVVVAYSALNSTKMKEATVDFPSTIGIYKGSSVRLLGVPVGQVTSVTPKGTFVEVQLEYKASTMLPADVGMAQVPPSIVSDRYLQFTPSYASGPVLADHALIPETRTEVPVELDQIFGSLNDLNVALGPNGANKHGALSQLIDVGAANLQGNGALFNTTLKGFSAAINALSNSRDALFGTITSLQHFTSTLATDDTGVRAINNQLSTVTGQLAGERTDLGAALANLATALTQVQGFVADNASTLTHDVGALTSITSGLVSEQQAIKEVLDEAPPALHNLALSFDPTAKTCSNVNTSQCSLGALSTRLDNTSNPSSLICTLVSGALSSVTGAALQSLESACTTAVGASGASAPAPKAPAAKAPAAAGVPRVSVPTVPVPIPSVSAPVGGLLGGVLGGTGTALGSGTTSGTSPAPTPLSGLGSILLGGAQ